MVHAQSGLGTMNNMSSTAYNAVIKAFNEVFISRK
jgi:hypothetical protein